MAREIARPRPVPSGLVVKNGSKISPARPGGTPAPRSATRTRSQPSSVCTVASTVGALGRRLDRVPQHVVERPRQRVAVTDRAPLSARGDRHPPQRRPGPERLGPRAQQAPDVERRPRPERAPGDDQKIGHQPIEPGDLRRGVIDGGARLLRQRDAAARCQIEPQLDRRQRIPHLVRDAGHHPPQRRQPLLPRQIAPHLLLNPPRLLEPVGPASRSPRRCRRARGSRIGNRRRQIVRQGGQRPLQPGGRPPDRDERIRRARHQQQRREGQRHHQQAPALQRGRRAHQDRRPEQRATAPGATRATNCPPSISASISAAPAPAAARAAVARIASRQPAGTAAAICAGAVAPCARPPRSPTTVDTVEATPAAPNAASRSISSRTASRPRSRRWARVTEMAR